MEKDTEVGPATAVMSAAMSAVMSAVMSAAMTEEEVAVMEVIVERVNVTEEEKVDTRGEKSAVMIVAMEEEEEERERRMEETEEVVQEIVGMNQEVLQEVVVTLEEEALEEAPVEVAIKIQVRPNSNMIFSFIKKDFGSKTGLK